MSLNSAKEFVNKIRFMNDLMQSLRNADENKREEIIVEAGYDFTFDELKQALSDYNDQLFTFVSGGDGRSGGCFIPATCWDPFSDPKVT